MAWSNSKYKELGPDWRDYRREYHVWQLMLSRCYKPNCVKYEHYGGRGIKVCDRWRDEKTGFINFYKDMGKAPKEQNGKSYQLDRINNDGDYSPENCRWITRKENMRNRRDTIKIIIYGDEYCAQDACKMFNLKRTTVTEAIRVRHKTPTDAFADALERRAA